MSTKVFPHFYWLFVPKPEGAVGSPWLPLLLFELQASLKYTSPETLKYFHDQNRYPALKPESNG